MIGILEFYHCPRELGAVGIYKKGVRERLSRGLALLSAIAD